MPEKIKKCTLLIVENNIIKSTLENREELSNYKVITLNELSDLRPSLIPE